MNPTGGGGIGGMRYIADAPATRPALLGTKRGAAAPRPAPEPDDDGGIPGVA